MINTRKLKGPKLPAPDGRDHFPFLSFPEASPALAHECLALTRPDVPRCLSPRNWGEEARAGAPVLYARLMYVECMPVPGHLRTLDELQVLAR